MPGSNATVTELPAFRIDASNVRVCFLWFMSLVCSLITASLALSVKQWLREYMAQDSISPQGYVRVRHFRREALVQRHVFGIPAVLPLLLQCALILFFVGLYDSLHSLYPALGWSITTVILIWLFAHIATILGPLFSANCPYKTPFLKIASYQQVVIMKYTMRYTAEWAAYLFHQAISSIRSIFRRTSRQSSVSSELELPKVYERPTSRSQLEQNIRVTINLDVEVPFVLDAAFIEDDFMDTGKSCLVDVDGAQVVDCVRRLMQRRTENQLESLQYLSFDNKDLTRNATQANCYNMSVCILSDAVVREINKLRCVHQLVLHVLPYLHFSHVGSLRPMARPAWNGHDHEAVPWVLRKLDVIPAQTLLGMLLSQDIGTTHQVLAHLSNNMVAINSWPLKRFSLDIPDVTGMTITNLHSNLKAKLRLA